MISERMDRRGLIPVFMTPEEVAAIKGSGKSLNDRVSELAPKRGASGSLTLQWRLTPVEDIDSAHADEKHYTIDLAMQFSGIPRQEGKLQLLENDPFALAECTRTSPAVLCGVSHHCPVRGAIAGVHQRLHDMLAKVTLADLFGPVEESFGMQLGFLVPHHERQLATT